MQAVRGKLVIITVLISVVAILLFGIFTWWQLYRTQATGTFFYQLTKIVPLPIATVDGEPVRYSDYLLNYRPSEYYLANYDDTADRADNSDLQYELKKRDALNLAESDAYARKLAKELNISVDTSEVDTAYSLAKIADNGEMSDAAYEESIKRYLDITVQDNRQMIYNSILRSKVAFAVDDTAKENSEKAQELIDSGNSFAEVAAALNKDVEGSASVGESGMVGKATVIDGLRIGQIFDNKVGEVSGAIQSTTGDGYFFVQVLEKDDTRANIKYLFIPLSKFKDQLSTLRQDGKITEYITINTTDGSAE